MSLATIAGTGSALTRRVSNEEVKRRDITSLERAPEGSAEQMVANALASCRATSDPANSGCKRVFRQLALSL
jgi:hypothetical protein